MYRGNVEREKVKIVRKREDVAILIMQKIVRGVGISVATNPYPSMSLCPHANAEVVEDSHKSAGNQIPLPCSTLHAAGHGEPVPIGLQHQSSVGGGASLEGHKPTECGSTARSSRFKLFLEVI